MGASETIVLGSRGSDLALTQVRLVEQALGAVWPDLEIKVEVIRTSGDEGSRQVPVTDRKAGRKGMFTREIERQLIVRRIDLAVHSAKDLPSEHGAELEIGAALPRGPIGDVLITRKDLRLTTLPEGGIVATGSVRRQYQLHRQRPDLEVVDLRGNVPTRLRKLREHEDWSGIILARAGLERLRLATAGREVNAPQMEAGQSERPLYLESLATDDFVPAGGQGIIALQVRREDERLRRLVDGINHAPTLLCLRAEREFLRLLEGDCDSPVGVHATLIGESLRLQTQVFTEQGKPPLLGEVHGSALEPEKRASDLMEKLYGH